LLKALGLISEMYREGKRTLPEKAPTLLKARTLHPKSALIAFNLACYASVAGHMEEAKERLQHAIDLDKDIRPLALDDEDLRSLWDWIGRSS
jgi:hypothetical protein